MRRTSSRPLATSLLLLALPVVSLQGQTPNYPAISSRNYSSGTAQVKVTGSFQVDEAIAINTTASVSDGEMTWLQFGNSGSSTPNALITYGNNETGVMVGRGKWIATATGGDCRGKVEVTATSVTGDYVCAGIVAYDAGSMKMGKVDITVHFRAGS